ncbi:filamin-C-like [Oppia nitens]|uniref:filamin-C-like n=1 Tax=Oppia nitens TaxID=1686743 RepID=UPI0023DCB9BE|nr:filamin-C-like [Oppia nitens]
MSKVFSTEDCIQTANSTAVKSQKLLNLHRVTANGNGLKFVAVKRPVVFIINAPGFQQDDISIVVTAPSSREIPFRMDTIKAGHYEVEYITPEIGEHLIEVKALGKAITGNPFRSFAYDSSKIKVGTIPNGIIGKPIQFNIDCSEAGSGNLEILVNNGRVCSEVKNLGNHHFLASFVANSVSLHTIEMKFNGEHVSGSPFKCQIFAPNIASNCLSKSDLLKVQTLESFPVGQTHSFDISASGFKKEDIIVSIVGPSKTIIQNRILDLQNDTFRVYFSVSIVGTYLFEINISGQPMMTNAFSAKAYDISRITVSETPKTCLIGHKFEFQVDASQAGEGQLEIAVNDGEVPNQVQVLGNGKCLVNFTPESLISHIVDIKFNGENVPGCPFVCEISDATQFNVDVSHIELIPVGLSARFNITSNTIIQNQSMHVFITSPNGKQLPVNVEYIDGCVCEFTPLEVGPHIITIEHCNRAINTSPFVIKAYDSKKVLVTPVSSGSIGKPIQFIVDASNSGEGNLEIAVNAKGENIITQVHPMGGAKFGVSFVANDNIDHIVSITFNGQPVLGSPFVVHINPDMNKVSVSGSALHFAPIDSIAVLTIHNILSESDLFVIIADPTGQPIATTIKKDTHSDLTFLEFMPTVPGEYAIQLKYKGIAIMGSPFSSKVYDIKRICVKEIPREIVIGKAVTFIVEATNAGPGNLEVIVNNGKVPSTPKALGSSLYAITFVPKDREDHNIDIKFNGEPVPGSPFTCTVLDASKVSINKEGLEKSAVLTTASFTIDTNGTTLSENNIIILGPTHKTLKANLTGDPQNGYKIEFTPTEVGDHAIDIKIGGSSVTSCPFLVKAYDSKNVRISEITSGTVGKPIYFSIDASAAGAGNLEIIVSANGRNVPNYVQSEGNAKFRVNFKPTEPSTHVLSVKFNGEPVPGSPYLVKVVDSTQSIVSGQALRMASLAKGVEFIVENRNDECSECKTVVTSPTGKKIDTSSIPQSNGFLVQFKPFEVGPHQVLVLLDGVTVPGCPFSCNIYDVNKVNISGLNTCVVGKPMTFQVDASHAGEGTLELVVTTKKSSVRAEVLMKSRGLYNVTFIPQEIVSHFINITFNEEDVPGSPFKIDVLEDIKDEIEDNTSFITNEDKTDKQTTAGLVGTLNVMEFEVNNCNDKIEAVVIGPNQSVVSTTAVKTGDNKIRLEYSPKEIGLHKMELFSNSKSVFKKPLFIAVCDPSRVKVNDLYDGVIDRENQFKVDTSKAGWGVLSVNIKSNEKDIPYNIKELSSNIFMVSFIPRIDISHQIDIRYNGHLIPGFPQTIDIRDPSQAIIVHGNGIKSSVPGENTTFIIETGCFASAKDFDIIVTDPNGSPLPVKCYQQKNGSLLVEWTPIQTGHHKVDVLHLDKPIMGSPFKCEIFDASKVKLEKIKLNNLVVNKKVVFSLTRLGAGYAELDVTITSPLGRHLPIEVKSMSDSEGELIEFVPTVAGKYKIAITYGGFEIPNSPITFIAQEGLSPKVEGNGLYCGIINEPTSFTINATGIYGTPEVRIDGPDSEAACNIEKENDLFHVTYVPLEIGVFDIRVLWNGKDIPESPFHPRIVNLQKIRIIGGWDNVLDSNNQINICVAEERKISFDISEGGPAKLTAKVKNPDLTFDEIPVEQTAGHKYRLCFRPKVEGEHQIYIYFADLLLPQTPIQAIVSENPQTSECATVVLRGHGLAGARVGEESEFTIDGTDAGNGQPEVTLTGVKTDIPVKVTQISSKVFKAVYMPSIQGTYLLNVIWGQKQVKGCPLKVSILPSCDAKRVICSGDGLKYGSIGKQIKAFIDTRRAGPGELTAHCVGPHKIAHCELYDQMDGTFTLLIKPQEGGKHVLTIKYGGEHVSGSAFTIRIAGAPDASKVRVLGPGIEHGVLPLYQSRFICDTRGAGAGQLTVRIRGPKGAFRVEMQRESQKDRTILCKYDPTEPGDYRIEVKWSGVHVPGSPFVVLIFDTQEELSRYLAGHYGTPSGASSLPPLNAIEYLNNGITYGTALGRMSWRGSTAEL